MSRPRGRRHRKRNALLFLIRADRNLIGPTDFLPLAERRKVYREQIARLRAKIDHPKYVKHKRGAKPVAQKKANQKKRKKGGEA